MRIPCAIASMVTNLAIFAAALVIGVNLPAGQQALGRLLTSAVPGLSIEGISGTLPTHPRIAHLRFGDATGTWVELDNVALDWSVRTLLTGGRIEISALSASVLHLHHLPATGGGGRRQEGGLALPFALTLDHLHLDQISLDPAVTGTPLQFSLDGAAALSRTLLTARVDLSDPTGSLAAAFLSDRSAASLHATLAGPLAASRLALIASAGPLRASATGTVDLPDESADLSVHLTAGAMAPTPAFAWTELALDGTARGSLNQSVAQANLTSQGLRVGSIDLPGLSARLDATNSADAGLNLQARMHLPFVAALVSSLPGSADIDVTLARPSPPDRSDLKASLTIPEVGVSVRLAGTLDGPDLPTATLALVGHASIADLARLRPALGGELDADFRLDGPPEDLTTNIDLTGTIQTAGAPAMGAITAHLAARNLPAAPEGRVSASGELAGAPVALAFDLARARDGTLNLAIDQASWRGTRAFGHLRLDPAALLPEGQLQLDLPRLADFAPFIGAPISGALAARLDLPASAAARLDAAVTDLRMGGAELSARLTGVGPPNALNLTLRADGTEPAGHAFHLDAAATANASAKRLTLTRLGGNWAGQRLLLRGPARFGAVDGLTVDRARLDLGATALELTGRLAPRLETKLAISNLTAATLHPLVSLPEQLAHGRFDATAAIADGGARIDATARLGVSRLAVTGSIGLSTPRPLDLRASGQFDLADLDPLLADRGAAARGRIILDSTIRGTQATPVLDGSLHLADGAFRDVTSGVTLDHIDLLIAAEADRLRIARATARTPSSGKLELSGGANILDPELPIDLHLTATAARIPDSDSASATLNADLHLTGNAATALSAAGTITLRQATWRIPERLPTSIRPIQIVRPGATPTPTVTAASGPDITLDLTISAADRLFLRGRGVEAELGGHMHLGGSLAAPRTDGGLTLRQGTVNFAGLSLAATEGTIRFTGAGLTDPDIHVTATGSSATTVATIEIAGPASNPKLTLSSVPPLPSDEILAQLLFGQGTSQLSPFQLAQIAQALATVSGVGLGLSDPLDRVRQKLALDRLSVGSGSGSGAVLDAGRYLRQGVYVGARQGLGGGRTSSATPATGSGVSGTDSQGVVQIDLTRRLKLEGTAGTGLGANSVGVTYQIDY